MTEAIIQIQDLEKRFRSKNTEVYALQGINLTIRKGDIFGIIGKSGAGKSHAGALHQYARAAHRRKRHVIERAGIMCTLGFAAQLQIAQRRSMGMIFQQFNLLMQRTGLRKTSAFRMELAGVRKTDAARERARGAAGAGQGYPDRAQRLPGAALGRAEAARGHRPRLWLPTPRSCCATRPPPPSTPPLRNPSRFRSRSRTSTSAWGSPPSSSRTK